jgi:hypothetical protein
MIPVLIIGKSGAGKSASLRNMPTQGTVIVNVLGKPLPFRSDLKIIQCDDYAKIAASINKGAFERCVIDDAGYLITNQFMLNHAAGGSGNSVFTLYNQMADHYWNLIRGIQKAPGNARVYLMMHEDKSDAGDVKPKTIGRLLDEKVCLEGMFTICLRAMVNNGKHVFRTQTDGFDVAKSPMDMFSAEEIDNDLAMVDDAIVKYYNIEEGKDNE